MRIQQGVVEVSDEVPHENTTAVARSEGQEEGASASRVLQGLKGDPCGK